MARKGLIETNNRKKAMTERLKQKRDALKNLIMNKNTPFEERFAASTKLAKMPRNSSATRIRQRCVVTGRPRGVYSFFGLSRVILREMASYGQLPGMRRSSW